MDSVIIQWLDAPAQVARDLMYGPTPIVLKDKILNDCSQNYTAGNASLFIYLLYSSYVHEYTKSHLNLLIT